MADDHHFCDEVIVRVETAVAAHRRGHALNALTQAKSLVPPRFDAEITRAIPAFERKVGIGAGPAPVMPGGLTR